MIGAVRQLPPKAYYQIADVRLQGLVYLLRDDERMQPVPRAGTRAADGLRRPPWG